MYELLKGLRVVEASSFVASPSAGLYLAQMGAEVIRVDQIGGGPDFRRWPVSAEGASFYWEGLNKAKKSVAVDLKSPKGREIVQRLATAQEKNAGLFVTNYPVDGFLSYERLKALREDVIVARIMGNADGSPALDYTVNCAVGIPQMTGPASLGDAPVNHVLPAWDLLAGAYAAFSLLAAERRRRETGQGGEIRLPLADLAIASVANLGQIAEVLYQNADRPRLGNDVYGAFGRDFQTKDGARVMIMALTARQWTDLVKRLDLAEDIAALENALGVSLAESEGVRFEHRDAIAAIVAERAAKRTLAELTAMFEGTGVCWGPYQSLRQAADDPTLVRANPVFAEMTNPSGFSYPTPGAAATLVNEARRAPAPAPRLGADTDKVLSSVLGLSAQEIAELHDEGVVASADD